MYKLILVIVFVLVSCEIALPPELPCDTLRYGYVEVSNSSSRDLYVNVGLDNMGGSRFTDYKKLGDDRFLPRNKRTTYTLPCGYMIMFVSYDSINWKYKNIDRYLTPCVTDDWYWEDYRLRSILL